MAVAVVAAKKRPLCSLTIVRAFTTKPITYEGRKRKLITVPVDTYVYIDAAQGVALIGPDHVAITEDQWRPADN